MRCSPAGLNMDGSMSEPSLPLWHVELADRPLFEVPGRDYADARRNLQVWREEHGVPASVPVIGMWMSVEADE